MLLAGITGVHIETAHRWKRAGRIPAAHRAMVQLRTTGNLSVISEHWSGWTITKRGGLRSPEGWEFQPGEVLSIPLRHQHIAALETERRLLRAGQLPATLTDRPAANDSWCHRLPATR